MFTFPSSSRSVYNYKIRTPSINEGARVIVTGRTSATIKTAQAELGDNAVVIHSDATSLPDMDALAQKVKETFGKLDVQFVNAGYRRFIPFEAVTEEVYDEMLNLNAKGPYFIVQKLVTLMPEGSSVVFYHEIDELRRREQVLGWPDATRAALIPIRKNNAWWDLSQDERRAIFEEQSHHIATGIEYLPAVARRLHHSRELGEPFDFLTWFEYAPKHAKDFEKLARRLREAKEWHYVDREVDIRLSRA